MRSRHVFLALLTVAAPLPARADTPFEPAPAAAMTNYHADVMPCRVDTEGPHPEVRCTGRILEDRTLRELSILRNTIYARYGWDGYRKPWIRSYFHAQPWFKPNPKFTYKLLSDADKKNAHFIAVREQSFTTSDLERLRDDVYARHGKVWDEKPEWDLTDGGTAKSCKPPRNAKDKEQFGDFDLDQYKDCRYGKQKWYRPDPGFKESELTADDRIELGLISRASGEFSLDEDSRGKTENALAGLLKVSDLRQLSLRDLRLLRNTIYARHGRKFKSQLLQEHFNGMDWYKLDPAYDDKLLTRNDTRNIAMIKSVENEFGGPLTDEDWLTEPATDGA